MDSFFKDVTGAFRSTWCERDVSGVDREQEVATLRLFEDFASTGPSCFDRTTLHGHMTGSAIVTNKSLSTVLLTLHKKLKKWLQLGGHADGHPYLDEVAMREAEEESGLKNLSFLAYEEKIFPGFNHSKPIPVDMDRHLIPERPSEPEHFHYDVRFVIVANDQEPLAISDESHDLKWFAIEDALNVTNDPSLTRQLAKLSWLRTNLR